MKLAPYIVGYLDLLGFSADVLREEEDPSHLMGRTGKFKALKTGVAKMAAETLSASVEIRWMSDTAVFACHIENLDTVTITLALRGVSIAMGIAQCQFGCEDYFSRGGIAIGRMLQTANRDGTHGPRMDDELFGAGVVRAAELEKVVARQPRVVVSARLVAAASELITDVGNRPIFRSELPDLPYIDYLSFAEAIWPERPDQVIAGHAELVHNLVVRCRGVAALRGKAAWLLEYHNWHVASRGDLEHLIVRLACPQGTVEEDDVAEGPSGLAAMRLRPEALRPVETWSPSKVRDPKSEDTSE